MLERYGPGQLAERERDRQTETDRQRQTRTDRHRQTETETETRTETETTKPARQRQTQRHTHTETHRQTHRDTQRQTHRDKHTETDTQRQSHRDSHTDRDTDRDIPGMLHSKSNVRHGRFVQQGPVFEPVRLFLTACKAAAYPLSNPSSPSNPSASLSKATSLAGTYHLVVRVGPLDLVVRIKSWCSILKV